MRIKIGIKDRLQNEKGAETIEMVILLPLLLFVIFSGIAFSLAVYAKICLADAARESARTVAVEGSWDMEISEEIALEKAEEVMTGYGLKKDLIDRVEVRTEEVDDTDNEYVYVKIVYKQPSIFPFLPKLIGNSPWNEYFMIQSNAVFKKESLWE